MGFSQAIVEVALMEIDKFKSNSSLYDAIVERDAKAVLYLIKEKYMSDVIGKCHIKEAPVIKIDELLQMTEASLSKNKQIRLLN